MVTYHVIIPESESDSNYAEFEYMLGWFDLNGNWQQKLFTDWENSLKIDTDIYNKERAGNIGAMIKSESDSVKLTVEDASLQDLKVYLSMFKAEQVYRIFKDGSYVIVAPDSNSLNYMQRGIRFQFSFDIMNKIK